MFLHKFVCHVGFTGALISLNLSWGKQFSVIRLIVLRQMGYQNEVSKYHLKIKNINVHDFQIQKMWTRIFQKLQNVARHSQVPIQFKIFPFLLIKNNILKSVCGCWSYCSEVVNSLMFCSHDSYLWCTWRMLSIFPCRISYGILYRFFS